MRSFPVNGFHPEVLAGSFRYCRWLTRQAHSHFSLSFGLLPKSGREAMEVVYAYCRALDDVVDAPSSSFPRKRESDPRVRGDDRERAQAELDRWRSELDACEKGFPSHPIAVAFQAVVKRYRIPIEYPEKLIQGVEMDLSRKRYATFEELQEYCEHVASVVGLICVRVFGCTGPEVDRYANRLGIALQLTNILRDLQSDAKDGRVYLPQEDLARFGVSEEELLEGRRSEPFLKLMAFECERAGRYFNEAQEALRLSGQGRLLLPARIMGRVYRQLLKLIEVSNFDVFSGRITVSRKDQLWIAMKCLTLGV